MDYGRNQDVVIKKVEKYWLEPNSSYFVENIVDFQLDFPICGRDFLFKSFNHLAKIPLSNYRVN